MIHPIFKVFGHFKIETTVGLAWCDVERHVGFFRGAIAFLDVTAHTCRDNVFPGIATAARSGYHMIESKFVTDVATILTGDT